MAINMPIQGSAAEMIKFAMIAIQDGITKNGMKSKMILQIHDELLFEVPNNEEDLMLELIRSEMENSIKLSVPIRVDCKSGFDWYEIH